MAISGVIKFLSVRAVEGIVAVILITFMPNLPPDAKYSQSYSLTPVLPFEGPLNLNQKLQGAEIWHKGDFFGPEAFAVYNDELYTTIHGGNVVKLIGEDIVPVVKFGKPCNMPHQEHICGRPLGMQFDKNGNLYVMDAYYGIFKVDINTGKQTQLVSMDDEINGRKPKLPNSVAIASNGDLYWTDSSTEFYLYDGIFDMLADGTGRLIHYDAKTKQNTVLVDKIHFANGVKLDKDENFVIVSETGRCRVLRYYLKGPKKGTHDLFLDGLPGLPDNIQTDGKNGFLIPLVIGRDDDYPPPLNIFGPFPLMRKFFSRIMGLTELCFKIVDQIYPSEWAEKSIHFIGHFSSLPHSFTSPRQTILHISVDGKILDSIHSMDASILGMSEAFIFKNMLYMGSPFNDYIARIPLTKVGWEKLTLTESDYPSSQPKVTISQHTPKVVTQAPPTQMPKVVKQPMPVVTSPPIETETVLTSTPKPATSTTPPTMKPTTTTSPPTTTTSPPTTKPATTTTSSPTPKPDVSISPKQTTTPPTAKSDVNTSPPSPPTTKKPTATAPSSHAAKETVPLATSKPAAHSSTPKPSPPASPPSTPKPATTAAPSSSPKPAATASPSPTQKPAATASPSPTSKPVTHSSTPKPSPPAPPPSTPKPATTAAPLSSTNPDATASPSPTQKPTATASPSPTPKPAITSSAPISKPDVTTPPKPATTTSPPAPKPTSAPSSSSTPVQAPSSSPKSEVETSQSSKETPPQKPAAAVNTPISEEKKNKL